MAQWQKTIVYVIADLLNAEALPVACCEKLPAIFKFYDAGPITAAGKLHMTRNLTRTVFLRVARDSKSAS